MQMKKALLIHEDGKTEDVVPENGSNFSLQETYKLLGCDIVQVVSIGNKHILIVDEEGKLKANEINRYATKLYNTFDRGDYIVGKAIMCHSSMFK